MIYSEIDINNILNRHRLNKHYYHDKFTESGVVMNSRQDWLFCMF